MSNYRPRSAPRSGWGHRGRRRGRGRGRDRGQRPYGDFTVSESGDQLTYHRLKEWATTDDAGDLALFMSNEIGQIKEFLSRRVIEDDWFRLFVSAVDTAIQSHIQISAVRKILDTLCSSVFLVDHLDDFIDRNSPLDERDEDRDVVLSLCHTINKVVLLLPAHVSMCISAIEVLSRNIRYDEELNKGLRMAYKMRNSSQSPHKSSSLPTESEILSEREPFIRPAKIGEAYNNVDEYLEIHYQLLKEDFLRPLRKGIADFKRSGLSENFTSPDIRLYHGVHMIGSVFEDTLDHVLKFDVSPFKSVNWDSSKRLIFGSLVCLSKDGFQSVALATVSRCDPKDLKMGYLNVTFKCGLSLLLGSTSMDSFVMVEPVAFFKSYCHVLEGLKDSSSNFPFQKTIVECSQTCRPPRYLQYLHNRFDLSPLMKWDRRVFLDVSRPEQWPSVDKMVLNPSQRQAAHRALTNQLAVIQGPPGTGKTYVSLKVVETLLQNIKRMEDRNGPILVVCYTNHALDQFLEGVLEFCPEGIIRVGGRSNSRKLKRFNLTEVRQKRGWNRSARRAVFDCKDRLNAIMDKIQRECSELELASFDTNGLRRVEDFIQPIHSRSLYQTRSTTDMPRGNIVHIWLNITPGYPREECGRMVENKLVELVFDGRIRPRNVSVSDTMPAQDRVALYLFFTQKLREELMLANEEYESHGVDFESARKISMWKSIIQRSKHEILLDSTIKSVIPEVVFSKIQKCIRNTAVGAFRAPNGDVVKIWLLGSHRDLSDQVDDVEQLLRNTYRSNRGSEKVSEAATEMMDIAGVYEKHVSQTRETKTEILRRSATCVIQRVFSMGLDITDDDSESLEAEWKPVSKKLSFAQIRRKLHRTKPMTETEERSTRDLWSLSMDKRFSLFKLWIQRYKAKVIENILQLWREYEAGLAEKEEAKGQDMVSLLQTAKVIGMTTTGAAMHRSVLQELGPRIIVVEEAAEVLEAHTIVSLNRKCEHLILVGDHQQLRPNPSVYDLAINYGLEISLFERLVKNKLPHTVLREQHRMRPQISSFIRHVYPLLKDHDSVFQYDHIRGVQHDVYFIDHQELESAVSDSRSKANQFEADYVVMLCDYFLNQGYEPSQITILATYAGQVVAIRSKIRFQNIDPEVHVTAVDNFQGEENDIIILSLVRSNTDKVVGFLKVNNRVNVALSRAKKGLFVIGNFKLLSLQSTLWKKIVQTATEHDLIGKGLPVVCQNHPEKQPVLMAIAEDFYQRPGGGCGSPCGAPLQCGHVCQRCCHGYDRKHERYECHQPCRKSCPYGHRCKRKCFQKCNPCKEIVRVMFKPCRHKVDIECHQKLCPECELLKQQFSGLKI